jgi:hypothetical protein
MAQSIHNFHATAITAYAVSWGLLMKLGEKGILNRQEAVDVLDFALVFVEQNAQYFSDQAATDAARQLVENLMQTFSSRNTSQPPPSGTQ